MWKQLLAVLCGGSTLLLPVTLCSAAAVNSAVPSTPFTRRSSSSLFSFGQPEETHADEMLTWSAYETYLMTKTRTTPFVLFFTSGTTHCIDSEEQGEGDDEEEEDEDDVFEWGREERSSICPSDSTAEELIRGTMERIAVSHSSVAQPIIMVTREQWPKAFHYHRIETTPSLLYLAPRSSPQFQRYPHPHTNFLDLSVHSNDTKQGFITQQVATFLRKYEPLMLSSSRTTSSKSSYSIIDVFLLLVLMAFLAVVVNENREVLWKVAQWRAIWLVLSGGVMFVALSGLFHSLIYHMPFFHYSPQHGMIFIHPSPRRQFVFEGMMHGSWSFWISFAAFGIVEVMPILPTRFARDEMFKLSLLVIGISYMLLYFSFVSKYKWMA